MVQDWSADTPGGPGRFEGLSGRAGTGQGKLPEVRDGWGDPRRGPEAVGGTQPEVWDGLEDFWRGPRRVGDPPGGP